MADLTPTEAFVKAMKRAKQSGGVSQAVLASRLELLGSPLSQSAIADIERGKRRVTIDEALAIAAALGVAPVHMLVPFEAEAEIPDTAIRVIDEKTGEPVVQTAADLGVFDAVDRLKVADLILLPLEARGWIRGTRTPPWSTPGDAAEERRFFYDETPPPRRYQLRELARQALRRREGRARISDREDAPQKRMLRVAEKRLALDAAIVVGLEIVIAEPETEES